MKQEMREKLCSENVNERLLGRPRGRLEDNNKTNPQDSRVDSCGSGYGQRPRPVNTVMNIWVPLKTGNFLTG